ncbi:MAG: glycosyltransferase family 2 protein [Candidatus Hodarchaeota archaeon]
MIKQFSELSLKNLSKPFVVACIPALNEERTIGGVVVQVIKHVDKVVVCDDGSRDLTGEIAKGLGAVVVRHAKNMGKGAALRTAFLRARDLGPDVVVMLDGDGQHNPVEIPRLVEPILDGKADFVVGSRYVEGSRVDAPLYRRLGLRFINTLSGKSSNHGVGDTQSGFRAFSGVALDVMLECEAGGYGVETEQLALAYKHGLRVLEVPVAIRYSGLGNTSKKHPLSHGAELMGTVLRLVVEERPLLILGLPGILFTLMGVFIGAYFLWFLNKTGYFSIPMALITLGSIVMGTLLIITSLLLYAIIRLRPWKNT